MWIWAGKYEYEHVQYEQMQHEHAQPVRIVTHLVVPHSIHLWGKCYISLYFDVLKHDEHMPRKKKKNKQRGLEAATWFRGVLKKE